MLIYVYVRAYIFVCVCVCVCMCDFVRECVYVCMRVVLNTEQEWCSILIEITLTYFSAFSFVTTNNQSFQ